MARTLVFRLTTHLAGLIFVALSIRWMWSDFIAFPSMEATSMILGYVSFLLIGVTLLIGPLTAWLPSRFGAACLSIRRDLGIWAGITAILHVILVLILFSGEPRLMIMQSNLDNPRSGWLGLFFQNYESFDGWPMPRWSLIGAANYLGLIAILYVISMLFTSSDAAKKWLGGSTWKRLHMANPFVFILVVVHGLTYIQSIKGEPHTLSDILLFAFAVWIVRIITFWRTVWYRRH